MSEGEEQGGVNQRRAPDSGDLTSSPDPSRSLTAYELCGKMPSEASTLPALTSLCLSSRPACCKSGELEQEEGNTGDTETLIAGVYQPV